MTIRKTWSDMIQPPVKMIVPVLLSGRGYIILSGCRAVRQRIQRRDSKGNRTHAVTRDDKIRERLSREKIDRYQAAVGKIADAFERRGDVRGACNSLADPAAFIIHEEESSVLANWSAY